MTKFQRGIINALYLSSVIWFLIFAAVANADEVKKQDWAAIALERQAEIAKLTGDMQGLKLKTLEDALKIATMEAAIKQLQERLSVCESWRNGTFQNEAKQAVADELKALADFKKQLEKEQADAEKKAETTEPKGANDEKTKSVD